MGKSSNRTEGIKEYLSNWKNWITNSIVAVAVFLIGFHLPMKLPIRLIILTSVISANYLRIKY